MKLIFHFGQQKAGSTALQNALYANRPVLARYGILYPSPVEPHADHGALARLVFEEDRWPRQISRHERNEAGKVEWQANVILSQIEKARRGEAYHTVILSSEYFFRKLSAENVDRISRLLVDGFDEAAFVCYIRHPVPRYLSSCLQRVRHSGKIPRPGGGGFRGIVESYADAFPVTVRAHDSQALTGGDITRDFVDAVIPELGEVTLRPSDRDNNVSLSPEIASILQEYNFAVYPEEADMVHRSANKLKETLVGIAEELGINRRATLKPEVARHIEKQSAEELAWLSREYGVTFPAYEPAPEDAAAINPKKLRWIQHVCPIDRRAKIALTSRIMHDYVSGTAAPRASSLDSMLSKIRRRLRAVVK